MERLPVTPGCSAIKMADPAPDAIGMAGYYYYW